MRVVFVVFHVVEEVDFVGLETFASGFASFVLIYDVKVWVLKGLFDRNTISWVGDEESFSEVHDFDRKFFERRVSIIDLTGFISS